MRDLLLRPRPRHLCCALLLSTVPAALPAPLAGPRDRTHRQAQVAPRRIVSLSVTAAAYRGTILSSSSLTTPCGNVIGPRNRSGIQQGRISYCTMNGWFVLVPRHPLLRFGYLHARRVDADAVPSSARTALSARGQLKPRRGRVHARGPAHPAWSHLLQLHQTLDTR